MHAENGYVRFHRATSRIRDELQASRWIVPPEGALGCASCSRSWGETENPDICGVYQYGSGFAHEYECTTCHTVRISAPNHLGIEMLRGKDKIPSGGRLGMLPGCGGIITSYDGIHLALNGGYYRKFAKGKLAQAGGVHEDRPFQLLIRFLAEGRLGDVSDGFIFVELWGRKPDVLMRNLRLTRTLSELWCCSDTGAVPIDLEALIATAKWLTEHDLVEKGSRPAFWKPIRDAAAGNHNSELLARWAKTVPNTQALLDSLPIDPHTRLRLPSLMASILPFVAGGKL